MDAGHNGLRDIMGAMAGGFWRLRLGISRPAGAAGQPVVNYVLGRPDRAEAVANIEAAISDAERITAICRQRLSKAMHRLHSARFEPESGSAIESFKRHYEINWCIVYFSFIDRTE